MAETYFENKNREAAVNTRRNHWTKISRFLKDHLIEKDETYSEEGSNAVRYKKIGVMVW